MKCFTDKYSKLGCDEKFLARLKIIKKKRTGYMVRLYTESLADKLWARLFSC